MQLDDEEKEPMRGMSGALDAEVEVQRTLKEGRGGGLLVSLHKDCRSAAHVDNKGIIVALRRDERKCSGP